MKDGVIYFDIGETLGAVFDIAGAPLPRLEAFSYVSPVLERLQKDGALLGVISHTGTATAADVDRMLEAAGLLRFFPHAELRIYSSVVNLRKDSSAIFELALGRALRVLGSLPTSSVFVGESRAERSFAVAGGMRAAPHPLLAPSVLAGGRPIYMLLRARRDDLQRLADLFLSVGVVPLRRSDAGPDWEIVALATDRALTPLRAAGIAVELLPEPADAVNDDLYLLRGLKQSAGSIGFAALTRDGLRPVRETAEGVIAALAPDQTIDDFHVADGHGHNLKLLGDPTLLSPHVAAPAFAFAPRGAPDFADATLTPEELVTLAATITEQRFEQVLRFVTGMDGRPDAVGGNRHVLSTEMRAVTDGLIAEFERIGQGTFTVLCHRFEITGGQVQDAGSPASPRIELHNVIAELPGETDEVVLVTAHLDSTAAGTFRGSYEPRIHPAPGVDDDGSGIAAVLLIAEFMRTIFAGRRPARTLRFALFNAEEQGLIGSGRYARAQAAAGVNIAAVFQMDMIAYNNTAPNSFEVHAGTSSDSPNPADPDVERASLMLANLVSRMSVTLAAEGLSILTPAQVLTSPDPAAGRSDHASFHARGYAAIAASEDFFPSPGAPADGNPNYHMVSDRVFDVPFATSIARVICAAALRTAEPATATSDFAAASLAGPGSEAVTGSLTGETALIPGAIVALRTAGAGSPATVAETAVAEDGRFTLHTPPGCYHLVVRAADGTPLASTHETPFSIDQGKPIHIQVDVAPPERLTPGDVGSRRAALFDDMTLNAAVVADIKPDDVLDMARSIVDPTRAVLDERFAAPSALSADADDPRRTLCGTERLRKLDRLAELQGYVDPTAVKLNVRYILAMGESGFATSTHHTPNFVISYQTDGPAAVMNDLSELEVLEPGSNPSRVIATIPGGTVPAYVRLVGFWLERSLAFYTSPPFSMRNPAANGRLSAFINADDFGSALPDGFYINNQLPPDLVCAVAVHELFHMVQYAYDGPGPWRSAVFEGGAIFAEDPVADLMNRYLDEAGNNFNGVGLLADPNRSLFDSAVRYKTSLFWRYLAEQQSHVVDEPTIGVNAYRRVIEECAARGYTTDSVKRAIRSLPFDADLCAFAYSPALGGVPTSSETTLGNYALACYLKDLPALHDARFGFLENSENIHIDDVVRQVIPAAPRSDTLVRVARARGRVTGTGAAALFQGRVETLASRYFEVEIAADVPALDIRFSAGPSFAGLVQIVTIEEDGSVRDIVRSDKSNYGRCVANELNGQRLSTVAIIVSGGDGGGSIQLSCRSASAVADTMITRWNSTSGKEYHFDPRGAAWTWVSPDLWFEPAADFGFVVRVRVHNKGSEAANNVSCELAYRPDSVQDADAPWFPIINADGVIQRIEGERIEGGAVREFALPWTPTHQAPNGIFILRARVDSPNGANPDNNVAFSRLGLARPGTEGFAALTASAAPTGSASRVVPRFTDSEDAARRALPGILAACPAFTTRQQQPDGSLASGTTMFLVEEAEVAGLANVAGASFVTAGRAPILLGRQIPLTRPEAGLFASEFWGISRHEAIAGAAERFLNERALAAVARITAPLGEDFPFHKLAGWADMVKRRKPGPNDDADTVAFLSDERNNSNDTWHYVNIPCHADGYDRAKYPHFTREDDVVQMIAAAIGVLAGDSDRFSALNALRLVIHLVGDVHQPIHVGCGYVDSSTDPPRLVLDARSRGLPHDRGGGRILLPNGDSLHAYWDGSLGSVAASGGGNVGDHDHAFAPDVKERFIEKLVDRAVAFAPAGFLANDPALWAKEWATESLIAAREAYVSLRITGKQDNYFKVSWEGKSAYDARCKPVSDARLAAAVQNLAALLNRVLG